MQTIALIEPNTGGHHLTYLRIFSKTLVELGYRVMAFSTEAETLEAWIECQVPGQIGRFYAFQMSRPQPLKLPLVGRVRQLPLIGHLPQPAGVLARWQHTAQIIETASQQIGYTPDLVFLNWLDSYLSHYLPHHLVDQVFPYTWAGLYFRPGQLRFKEKSGLKPLLPHCAIARSSHCKGIGVLDEGMVSELQKIIRQPVIPFPDFADESPPDLTYELVQRIRAQAGQRKIIGLFGALSKRKGMVTLLRVAQRSLQENWFFVFAGSLSESTFHQDYEERFQAEYDWIYSVVNARPPNCLFHFERIPQESQFNALVYSCDVLFAAYENFPYSSNILAKSAAFKKPVIASAGGCMGRRVERFEIGLTISEGSVDECIQALQKLLNSSSKTQLKLEFEGYHSLHSHQRLKTIFANLINMPILVKQRPKFTFSNKDDVRSNKR